MTERIDPITLEIIQNGLATLAEEMTLTVLRTGYSLTLRETQDFSMGICDHLGQFVAQYGSPIHLGSFPGVMRKLVAEHAETTRLGDVFISNDPYGSAGMHLPDVFVIKPVFADDRVVGYAVAMGHQCDMGGITPGSMAVHATEIYQEGLRIPLMKFYDAGEPNRTLIQLIEKNVRVPVLVMGDLDAQVAACRVGERGLIKLIERYGGADAFATYTEALHDYAERMMRQEIAALPDGVYEFEDYIDGMGEDPEPIRFKVAITIAGDGVRVDWAGTSKQIKAAINGPRGDHLFHGLHRHALHGADSTAQLSGFHTPDRGDGAFGEHCQPDLAGRLRVPRHHRLPPARCHARGPGPGRPRPRSGGLRRWPDGAVFRWQ